MSVDPDLLVLDDLPDDARAAIEEAERAVAAARAEADRQTAAIQERCERECAALRAAAEAETAAVQLEVTREVTPLAKHLVEQLRAMQEKYARAGKLDEALAVRARLRQIRADLLGVQPDPGNLTHFGPAEVGRSFLFEVTGRTDGTVWGTDVYTADSRLAAAAVHAGAVREGDRGLVRVLVFDGVGRVYEGSGRNGVLTLDYPAFPVCFRVERV